MYAASPDSLIVELGSSRALTAVLVLLHVGAAVLAFILPIAFVLKVLVVFLVALSLARSVYRHGLRHSRGAITAMRVTEEEYALRRRNANDWETGRLVDRWVQPWLTIVVVQSDGRRWPTSVVICPDAVASDAFRRLRVRLRLRTAAARV